MTNKDLYATLVRAGAPELPKEYFYKFWIAKKETDVRGRETKQSRALYCSVRKKIWGGLFYVSDPFNWYWARDELHSWSNDSRTLIETGRLTEEQTNDGTYHLEHMALLADDAWTAHLDREAKEAREKLDKSTESIAAYLNKRIP